MFVTESFFKSFKCPLFNSFRGKILFEQEKIRDVFMAVLVLSEMFEKGFHWVGSLSGQNCH